MFAALLFSLIFLMSISKAAMVLLFSIWALTGHFLQQVVQVTVTSDFLSLILGYALAALLKYFPEISRVWALRNGLYKGLMVLGFAALISGALYGLQVAGLITTNIPSGIPGIEQYILLWLAVAGTSQLGYLTLPTTMTREKAAQLSLKTSPAEWGNPEQGA